jgi:CheY-like chemotaxis protein
VTDVEMPNGFELARRVRERLPGVAIVIVSGRARPGQHDLPEGALFVSKPFQPTAVVTALNDLLTARGT